MTTAIARLTLCSALAAFTLAACSSGPAENAPPAPAGKPVDPATAGSIAGTIRFEGTPPPAELIRMASDPACAENAGPNPQSDAVLVSDDGSLQNVFVYLKDGLDPEYGFETPTTPVVLDQHGCQYTPRVLGIQVNQPLEVANDDPTFHNVHARPAANQEFNQGLLTRGDSMTHAFTAADVMVPFRCDVHGWMAAYVGVLPHPFFAVTGADGAFALTGVPPGAYTIEAWHERFGTQTAEVTLGAGETESLSFAFSGE